MLIDIEDAHIFWMSIFGKVSNVAVAEATDARRPTMSPYLGGMAARFQQTSPCSDGNTRTLAMTNKTACHLLKFFAAVALIATFSSTSFASEFTVQQGKRYRATLHLNSVERLVDNGLIESKFRALGFSGVRVSGTGATRRVEGVWTRKDASAPLPPQIFAVARL